MKRHAAFIILFLLLSLTLFARGGSVAPGEVVELAVLMPGTDVPANEEAWAIVNEESAKDIGYTYRTEWVSSIRSNQSSLGSVGQASRCGA